MQAPYHSLGATPIGSAEHAPIEGKVNIIYVGTKLEQNCKNEQEILSLYLNIKKIDYSLEGYSHRGH
jgi:hypothetical protein